MKKERENQPIDDLFARKLGNLSLPPSTDGFDRLRSRMAPTKATSKVVFWRNPAIQRYMAVAACLVLVCLLGWLYRPTGYDSKNPSLAIQQLTHPRKAPNEQTEKTSNKLAHQQPLNNLNRQKISGDRITRNVEATLNDQQAARLPRLQRDTNNEIKRSTLAFANQTTPTVAKRSDERATELPEPINVASTNSSTPRQLESTAKSSLPAERVLVVTIDEPAVLVAARQEKIIVDEKTVVASEEKSVKEAKTGGLWQKIKQLKQGEMLAKGDNLADDDQGLLSRAYTGLKHSVEKSKTTKQ